MKKSLALVGLELAPIIVLSLSPLFFNLSYQINLYLTWEGAYRLYSGEIPYRDFGMPMGFCYWILPTLFFKIFGPSLITLAKTQAFINIISGLSFRWILVNLSLGFRARFLSIIIFSLTYIMGLYWPQYNHVVIVYQFIGLGFLFHYFAKVGKSGSFVYLIASFLFFTISFFTKQDGGGLALLIGIILITIHSYLERSIKPILITSISLIVFFAIAILPFIQYDFGYWFNYGQAPHYSRISILDLLQINMKESRWEKLYLVVIAGLYIIRRQRQSVDKNETLFTLLVIGIIFEAMIFQVTSYVPKDNNIFFHAFSCAFILFQLEKANVLQSRLSFCALIILVTLWWSEKYWGLADKIIGNVFTTESKKDVVSVNTYILEPEACNYYSDLSTWKESTVEVFKHVKMPASTVAGIDRFLAHPKNQTKQSIILNMSELTPLAAAVPFTLEKGPLWFHLGVGLFQRELDVINSKIESDYYDIVIFENIPLLNNFYPFSIHEKLLREYELVDSFEAPRIVYPGTIEIYHRKSQTLQ